MIFVCSVNSDPESGIKSVYMCLGLNDLNCDILGWTETPSLSEIRVNFEIPDGQRAWIRLRVTNNGKKFTISNAR